jgi:hypothetical protein
MAVESRASTIFYSDFVRYNRCMTENATSADNQQERPLSPFWITGFVDGEGCFSISFVRQQGGIKRTGYKIGYQVLPEFVITQGAKSLDCLHDIQNYFGVGQVLINRRKDNHKETVHRYVVRKRDDLLQVIIPFFVTYPLRTAKQLDFIKFRHCLELISRNRHMTIDGLRTIVQISETMNRQKSRHELLGILRDYTPDAATAAKI